LGSAKTIEIKQPEKEKEYLSLFFFGFEINFQMKEDKEWGRIYFKKFLFLFVSLSHSITFYSLQYLKILVF